MGKIEFKIEGSEYELVEDFKIEHRNCIEDKTDTTGAQFKYEFIVDGRGVLKMVKCVCGKTIVLTDDYDLGASIFIE